MGRALRSYADRGVFRGFVCREKPHGRREYSFRWLTDATFHLRFDPASDTLTVQDLLPNVPYRSDMDRSFRSFVGQRSSDELPEHRRIDPKRVELRCSSRKGSLSVTFDVKGRHFDYATRKAVSLVSEIFHGFLRGPYYEYMVENFNEPEE